MKNKNERISNKIQLKCHKTVKYPNDNDNRNFYSCMKKMKGKKQTTGQMCLPRC